MEARAIAKFVRVSPRKMKPIADLVRGRSVKEALAILKYTPRKGARIFYKVMKSAVANAENNHEMTMDTLVVAQIFANQGPVMKRFKAGSMGRANPVKHRTSHVGVVVAEKK